MITVSLIVFRPTRGVVSKAFSPLGPTGLGLKRCILGLGQDTQVGKTYAAFGQPVTVFSVCCPFRLVSSMLFEE